MYAIHHRYSKIKIPHACVMTICTVSLLFIRYCDKTGTGECNKENH